MRLLVKLIGTVVVLVLVLGIGVLLLPGERIARIAGDQFEVQTGRSLTFTGKVRFSLYPILGVKTEGLELGNASWSTRGPMLKAKSASIGIDAMALLGGKIKVRRIEAQAPKVLLEKAADGRANWEFGATSEDVAGSAQPQNGATAPDITLNRLIVRNAAVRYFEANQAVVKLKAVDADLHWPKATGPASVSLSLRPGDDKVTIKAEIGDMKGLLAGAVTPLAVKLNTADGEVGFEGRASIAPELAGAIDLTVDDTARFARALGLAGVTVPNGFGKAMAVSGHLTVTKSQEISLRNAKFQLDHNALAGDVDVVLKDRPLVTARLSAGVIDLSSVAGSGDAGAAPSSTSGWSKSPIDLSALGLIDGEIALRAEGLNTGDYTFGALNTRTTIDNSRAVIDLREFRAFGGNIKGKVIANNRKGFSTRVNVKADGVDMQRLLSETADISRFTGTANVAVNVLASGKSVYGLMNSLDGSMTLKLGEGTISGIDLDALMSGRKGGGTTVFDSISATGAFSKGVLNNDDLIMKLAVIEATGKGQIGIGQRNINYEFTPVAVTSGSETISLPVKIRGSWDDPDISVDLARALDVDLEEELDKAKDKAREKLNQKVDKELGVTREDGQSLEDAVGDKLEKKVEKGLLKLLGQD